MLQLIIIPSARLVS